jgi:hypothetical protein
MSANSSYDDLIEISACTLVLSDLIGREVPRRVHELISKAADLRGAWDGFPEDRGARYHRVAARGRGRRRRADPRQRPAHRVFQ